MSKILELLHYSRKRGSYKKEGVRDFPDHTEPENFDSATKEKLASTYILNPTNAGEHTVKRQNERIPLPKHGAELSKARSTYFFPWLISFLAVLLLLVNIAYRGKININIEVLKEAPRQVASNASKNFPPKKDSISGIKSAGITPISISLISGGRLNRYIIKKIGFYGAAISKSGILEDGLYLFNDGSIAWASAGIDLTKPIDFSDTTLDFFIKGASGGESLKLILRDAENNTYMPQAYNIIFDKNMGTDWQFISVPFKRFDGAYNLQKINHIGFEFGTQTTSNDPGASIHVKNIKIVENTLFP